MRGVFLCIYVWIMYIYVDNACLMFFVYVYLDVNVCRV